MLSMQRLELLASPCFNLLLIALDAQGLLIFGVKLGGGSRIGSSFRGAGYRKEPRHLARANCSSDLAINGSQPGCFCRG